MPSESFKKLNPHVVFENGKLLKAISEIRDPVPKTTDERKLNKLESEYLDFLQQLTAHVIHVQAITFKLGDDCRYTPDFVSCEPGGKLCAHEVKGFWRDDAKVKIKVAARMYPWIRFVVAMKKDNQWDIQIVNP